MRARSAFAAVIVALLFALGMLAATALSGTAQPAAKCTTAQHAKNHRTLAAFKKQMAKQRAAYFRAHKSPKLRAKFVKTQKARLAVLTKAAACKVIQPAPKATTKATTTVEEPLPPTISTTTTPPMTVTVITMPGSTTTTSPSTTTTTTTTTPRPPGPTLKFNMSSTDVDFTDPSLAYGTISWQLEYATALKLFNYPDAPPPDGGRLVPEAATGFPLISPDGKTYTITVKPGFRFSDGRPVTAENFAFSINRALNPVMRSPATSFIQNIVGAQDVIDGRAQTASGVRAAGDTLIIALTQPDGSLLAKLAMPFFQALPLDLPLDANGVNAYPSAGPYYFASREVARNITIKRNPYYTGSRPAYADEFDITANTNLDQSLEQVKSGAVDYDLGGLPATAHADLGWTYGVNAPNGRYHVSPLVETDYIALNTSRPPFSNVNLRKAFNYAIDRPGMVNIRGAYAATPTDQILPPGIGGFHDAALYPLDGPDYATAKILAGSSCGRVNLWSTTSAVGQLLADAAKYALGQMGCDVWVKLFQGPQLYLEAGQQGADFDAALVVWNQDYPDPSDFLDTLLNGEHIHAANNNNLAYFNDPAINAKLDAANLLVGADRYDAYGKLDVEIMRDYAPWVAYGNRNAREFTSARLIGYLFQPANATADLNTFSVKP